MCDVCVQIFGEAEPSEYLFRVDLFILSRLEHVKVSLKPPTAGTRVICIDGGGVRGAVALESLTCLQKAVGPECPLQGMFDIAFGTSSGMYIWENPRCMSC